MTLPVDAAARKAIPIYSGFIKYFPDAIAAVAELSRKGNDQHNPGQPLHWDRSKSSDELDAMMRHVLDDAAGKPEDTDGVLHATKVAWRAMANLQKLVEPPRTVGFGWDAEKVRTHGVTEDAAKLLGDGWHTWKGGDCPVAPDTKVEVRFDNGSKWEDIADTWCWDSATAPIVAWRLA